MKGTEYKVVECMVVTDESLTEILNEWTAQGWAFEGINFVPNEGSKRPKMAFVVFTRQVEICDGQEGGR